MLLLALSAGAAVAAAPAHRASPAHHGARAGAVRDWSRTVAISPAGGFVMGNPNAPVKVIEFASYTCPHCAAFSRDIEPQLVLKYVRTGQASYEFRNAARDRYDVVAAVLARCTGVKGFFPATTAVYAAQSDWISQAIAYEQAHADEIDKLEGVDKGVAIARAAGLDSLFAARGLTLPQQRACLGDEAELKAVIDMSQDANENRHIPGTPAVFVNDDLLPGPAEWPALDAAVGAALKKGT